MRDGALGSLGGFTAALARNLAAATSRATPRLASALTALAAASTAAPAQHVPLAQPGRPRSAQHWQRCLAGKCVVKHGPAKIAVSGSTVMAAFAVTQDALWILRDNHPFLT